jgi:hypothetical protein
MKDELWVTKVVTVLAFKASLPFFLYSDKHWITEESAFHFWYGQEVFIFSKAAQGPTQSPAQWVRKVKGTL